MIKHEFNKRVRYAETDRMGYMYYGNYPTYYEIGRVEALRFLGLSYKSIEDEGILMPVVNMNARYIRPALYDQMLTIKTEVRTLPSRFITFHTEIFNENNKLINGGIVKLCFVNTKTNKTVDVPQKILNALKQHIEK